ncbi:MAG: hypothetical protein WCT18_01310 [Patescibacteria group bacterium]
MHLEINKNINPQWVKTLLADSRSVKERMATLELSPVGVEFSVEYSLSVAGIDFMKGWEPAFHRDRSKTGRFTMEVLRTTTLTLDFNRLLDYINRFGRRPATIDELCVLQGIRADVVINKVGESSTLCIAALGSVRPNRFQEMEVPVYYPGDRGLTTRAIREIGQAGYFLVI